MIVRDVNKLKQYVNTDKLLYTITDKLDSGNYRLKFVFSDNDGSQIPVSPREYRRVMSKSDRLVPYEKGLSNG